MADERTLQECLRSEARDIGAVYGIDDVRASMLRRAANALDVQSTRLAQLENTAANYKALFDELCGYVAFMCEHFGDKRDEIPCDAWRLRDHVMRAKKRLAQLEAFRAEVEGLRALLRECLDAADFAGERAWSYGFEHKVEKFGALALRLRAALSATPETTRKNDE